MTTQTFTAQDVADFAEMIRPHFDRIGNDGLSAQDRVVAAAQIAKVHEERETMRRYNMLHVFADALSGTYEEFRSEAAR